ncbi:MAG: hypothetical protein KGJ60_03170 [Verrucomicrobiota bacterium]|nr:hypothetical protein [Verrucomicrobiota bacterium]
MNTDEEHLKLLSIFHYVVAGCAAFIALFPVIYIVLGLFMLLAPASFADHGQPPPAFAGWIFVVMGSVFMTLGWIFAAFVFAAGRCLARRKHYTFCLVMACVECLFMPFGTVLGVFSIIVLMREPVKQIFGFNPPAPGGQPS